MDQSADRKSNYSLKKWILEEIENMARTYNFGDLKDVTTFNIGDVTLEFKATDEKSEMLEKKSAELKAKAEQIDESGTEWELRKELKDLLDEFFTAAFDGEAPQKLYDACGQNTISYLKLFLQIADALREVNEERQNDEAFKKYLAE
jgi:hypothetical protein